MRFVGLHDSLLMGLGQDQLLYIVRELAGGGFVAVAVGTSDI